MSVVDRDEVCGFCGEYDIDAGGSCRCFRCGECGELNLKCTCAPCPSCGLRDCPGKEWGEVCQLEER